MRLTPAFTVRSTSIPDGVTIMLRPAAGDCEMTMPGSTESSEMYMTLNLYIELSSVLLIIDS